MSAPVLDRPAVEAGPRPSLLRAEVRRFRSRRLVRLLLAVGLVLFVVAVGLSAQHFASPSPEGVAAATAARQDVLDEQRRYRAQCLADPARPSDLPAEEFCGQELTAEDLGPLDGFLPHPPFLLARDGPAGLVGVAVLAAGLAFLLGATYVGAEWSSRSLVALLFWEPRRVRVLATKTGVLAGAAALLGLLGAAGWLVAARVLAATRGLPDERLPRHFWSDTLGVAGRGVVLVVLLGLLGLGIAHLLRSTAAATGAAFAWFVVVENVLRAVRRSVDPYLLTTAASALVQDGGARVYLDEGYVDGSGSYVSTGKEVVVGNLQGGLELAAVVAVVLVVGAVLFARRDLD